MKVLSIYIVSDTKIFVDLMRPHFGNLHHVTIDSWFTGPKLSRKLKQWNGMPFSFFKPACWKGMIVKSQGPLIVGLYSYWRHVTVHVLSVTGSFRYVRYEIISRNVFHVILCSCEWNAIKPYAHIVGIVHDYRLRKITDFNLEWYVRKTNSKGKIVKNTWGNTQIQRKDGMSWFENLAYSTLRT